jgi:hypothetical protein
MYVHSAIKKVKSFHFTLKNIVGHKQLDNKVEELFQMLESMMTFLLINYLLDIEHLQYLQISVLVLLVWQNYINMKEISVLEKHIELMEFDLMMVK